MRSRRALPRVMDASGIAVLASASMGPAYSLASTMGLVVGGAGALAPLAVGLLSALMLCVAVGFARLSRTHPDAGSSYGWTEAAFGRGAGAYAAWLLLLSNFFATMATAIPAGTYTLEVVAPALADSAFGAAAVGTLWILASAILLAAGLRPTAGASALFLVAEFAVVIASAVAVRLAHLPFASAAGAGVADASAAPIAGGLGGFASAMVLGIWMADGWEVSASASEETTEPRAAGRGGIAGLVVTTLVVVGAMLAYLRLGPGPLAGHATDDLAFVATALGGGGWRVAIAATVLVSTAATLWTTMLYLSRSVYAMGRSGLLPRRLGEVGRRGSPDVANVAVALAVGLATLAAGFVPSLARALALVLGGTSVFLGLLFVVSVAAGIRLARPGDRFLAAIVPGIGGAGLLAVVGVTLWQSDAVTREIDFGGLALGLPLVAWRMRVTPRPAPSPEDPPA